MSSTGNKSNKGFTLIEVLVTTAVLSFGIVSVFQALFIIMSAFGYVSSYLNVIPALDEKMWEVSDAIRRLGPQAPVAKQGIFEFSGRKYEWKAAVLTADKEAELYRIDLAAEWKEGRRENEIIRSQYVFHEIEEEAKEQ